MFAASDDRPECFSCSRISGRLARLETCATGVALLVALEASGGSFAVPVLLVLRHTVALLKGTTHWPVQEYVNRGCIFLQKFF